MYFFSKNDVLSLMHFQNHSNLRSTTYSQVDIAELWQNMLWYC